MSKFNEKMFEHIELHNMKWEKQELENIIEKKKNDIEEYYLNEVLNILNEVWIEGNTKPTEKEMRELLTGFLRTIKEIEREN